jgi:hypothetical protein
MSFEIQGRINLKLLINGWEFPFDRTNSLGFLHMSSGVQISVPMIHLVLQDNSEVLTSVNRLTDGALIQVILQVGEQPESRVYNFRTNSIKRTPNEGGNSYEIDGYFNNIRYWQESATEPITATSSGALKQITDICGLEFDGDATTDSQTWWPRNRRYHEWVHTIKEHGFLSELSCMRSALNLNGKLVYKDLSKALKPVAKFSYIDPKPGFFLVTDALPVVASGAPNHFVGYADRIIEQNLSSDTFNKVTKEIQVKKKPSEGSLSMSATVKSLIKQANVSFGPLDPGNAHADYLKAAYQNKRISSLFSTGLDVLTPQPTDLNVLDPVYVTMERADGYLKMHSGDYHVVSRTIYVQGSNYYERLNLRRKTTNAQMADALA